MSDNEEDFNRINMLWRQANLAFKDHHFSTSPYSFCYMYFTAEPKLRNKINLKYGVDNITKIVEYADKKNLSDFEKQYNIILNAERYSGDWNMAALQCITYFDGSSEKTKKIFIKKYGQSVIDSVRTAQEDVYKHSKEQYNAQFLKAVPKDIMLVSPVIDDCDKGLIFYSKEVDKYFIYTEIPFDVGMNCYACTQCVDTSNNEVSWNEIDDILISRKIHNYFSVNYVPQKDKLLFSVHQTITKYQKNYEGYYEYDGAEMNKIKKEVENVSKFLKEFNKDYFNEKNSEFIKTKEYLTNIKKLKNL